jgi:hypothetical protein
MRFLGVAFCVPVLLAGGMSASAAPGDPIGSAVSIVNLVTAELDKSQRRLAKGDDVRQQELIEVSRDGLGELVLRDDTKLALGPGSRLLLDQFIYNPDISGGAIVLDLVRGAFRFVTGLAAKPAYVIRMPTASITVRGTIFDVYVETGGAAWLLLIEGAVEVCLEDGTCRVHDEPGKLIHITSGELGSPGTWRSLKATREVKFDDAFPFVVTAPAIDPKPVFTRDEIVLGTFPPPPGKNDKAGDDGRKDDKADDGRKNDDKADSDDDDGGRKASGGKPRKKAKTYERKREARRKREREDDAAVEDLLKSQSIGIGTGGGFGGPGGRRGGMDGGGYNRGGK